MNPSRWLLVALGGGLGSLSRYAVSGLAHKAFGDTFAWGTFAVNVLGCLVIGFMFALADQKQIISSSVRLFFMVGFLGAFTTFSTYSLESMNFIRNGESFLALANVAANNLVGAAFVVVGFLVGRGV